jgi:hypothetical protein
MGLLDRVRSVFGGRLQLQPAVADGLNLADLPLQPDPDAGVHVRREAATTAVAQRRADAQRQEAIGIGSFGSGLGLDGDDYQYRRLTGNSNQQRRDLTPLQQDRMLEIVWYLWEQNAFARRLITLMSDLILADGITVEAVDSRIQDQVNLAWDHRVNQLSARVTEFHNALSVNGELIIPVALNPINGVPTIGFIDPYQVKAIESVPDNVLIPDVIVLKAAAGTEEKRLKIIREDPLTGRLEGEAFYLGINKLPNSLRGRSDLSTLADWLDLYDTYLFAEVERLHLLSAFVWDYKIEGADEPAIRKKVKDFPRPKPGTVFAHNEKESLSAQTPDLKAADRSEAGRMLRVHIAGSFGFPLSYLGEIDSNKSTIEGQNDILLKTPARRQKEFAGLIDQIVRFTIEQGVGKNRILFQDANPQYRIRMPEIAAKDIARAGTVLTSVITAMDTAMANRTASRQLAVTVLVAMLKQLGIEADPSEVMDQADEDDQENQDRADDMQARLAAKNPNPPVPGDDPTDDDPEADDVKEAQAGLLRDVMAALTAERGRPVNLVVNTPDVSVPVSVKTGETHVDVTMPKPGTVRKETTHQRTAAGLLDTSVTVETPVAE